MDLDGIGNGVIPIIGAVRERILEPTLADQQRADAVLHMIVSATGAKFDLHPMAAAKVLRQIADTLEKTFTAVVETKLEEKLSQGLVASA